MGITPVEFEVFCQVGEDVAKTVKRYLLGEIGDGIEKRFERKASSSSSGSEERLYPNPEKRENVEDWNNWGDEEKNDEETDENDESSWNWLFKCAVKTYLDAEYFLVSYESRFVLLRKPPSDNHYKIVCKQYIDGDPISSEITASCLFGLINSRHSDQMDCIIISLGTLDGHVYFYTEKGTLLYFDRFSIYESVANIHFEHVKTSQVFLVVFSRTFFVINPVSLNAGLHQAKIKIAKGEKNVQEVSDSIEIQCDLIDPDVKGNIIHVVFTGFYKPSTFEQYMNATWQSFNARVERPSLPTFSTFLVTTEKCFVTFVWHDRDQADQIWSEAIKYGKSLLPSFGIRKYFGISTEPAKKAAHMHSAQHAPTRSQILDPRVAQNVSKSPDGRYVAIADRQARVIVIDVQYRTTVLMFKGYRDASISWVSTIEGARYAQFLAIFAPRRSLLEVWTVLGNVRVCARHVPSETFCDLVTGGENRTLCGMSFNHFETNSFFIDGKGTFNRLVVPFHLALNGRASQDQHDQLLLKKIEKQEDEQWIDTFSLFKLASSRRTAFQNHLQTLKTTEEAHKLLDRIKTISSAQSLGNFISEVEKSIVFYQRVEKYQKHAHFAEKSEFDMCSIIHRIVECHLARFESENSESQKLIVGEWLTMIDLNSQSDIFTGHWNDEFRLKLANLIFSPVFNDFDLEEYEDVIVNKLPFSKPDLVKLLCAKFEKCGQDLTNWTNFDRVVRLLVLLEKSHEGLIELVDRAAVHTRYLSRAIVLLTVCWCARNEMKKTLKIVEKKLNEEKDEDEDEFHEADDWDAVQPELEHLDSILMCLHCVSLSTQLTENENEPRVADISHRIDSFCRENVAKWVVDSDIEYEEIAKLFPKDPTEVLDDSYDEEKRQDNIIIDYPVDDKSLIISRIYQIIPRSFEHDLVIIDVCWEVISTWFRDKDNNFNLIAKCTDMLKNATITDQRLRHGITRLIWDKFIGPNFEAIVMLVEKNGRIPKEREIRKEVGFSETRIVEFLVECEKLLGILMDSVREVPGIREYNDDLLIQMMNSSFLAHQEKPKQKSKPVKPSQDKLAIIAAKQPLVNYHLVLHHYHLALAIRLQLSVGLRIHPLRNLFCLVGNRAFFVSLDSHPLIPLENVEDSIIEKRHAFLTKIAEQGSTNERRLAKTLEGEWNLTVNSISFMQALSSFRLGNDVQGALELVGCVHDERAASSLVRVLAARMVRLMSEKNSLFTPAHSNYILNLAGEETARVELWADSSLVNGQANPQTWEEAIESLGRKATAVAQSSQSAKPFVRLNDIATQYWGIQWI